MKGNCKECEYYREMDAYCHGLEKLSDITDPICLAKIIAMLINDTNSLLGEYLGNEEDERESSDWWKYTED